MQAEPDSHYRLGSRLMLESWVPGRRPSSSRKRKFDVGHCVQKNTPKSWLFQGRALSNGLMYYFVLKPGQMKGARKLVAP